MHLKPTYIIVFSILMTFIGCAKQEKKPIEVTEWIIGTWQNNLPSVVVYEEWSKTDDETLSGRSYIVAEGDTTVFETIVINQKESGMLEYIPTIVDQNEGQPVVFTLTALTEDMMRFENTKHDFPQLISYKRLPSDSLVARVYGIQNGSERDLYFKMKRIK